MTVDAPGEAGADIVIPVYNGLRHVRACLESVLRFTDPARHRLIVVDDASGPATAEELGRLVDEGWGERGTVLTNEHNVGFVQTANRGMTAGESPTVVLLNSDTLVAPGWLEGLLACLETPDVGIASPVSNHANLTRIDVPYGVDHLRLAATVRRISPRAYPEIRFAMGFCLAARRPLLEELDYFDERYGRGYREESDLCLRAEELGWRTVADDATYVHHHGWGSFGHGARTALMERNGELFRERWGAYPEQLQQPIRRQRLLAGLEDRVRAALHGRAQVAPRRPLPRRANRRTAEEARQAGAQDAAEPQRRGERRPPMPPSTRHGPAEWQRIATASSVATPPTEAGDVLVLLDDLVLDPWVGDAVQLVDRLAGLGLTVALATSGSFDPAVYSDPCRVRPFVLAGPDELLATVPAHRVVLATSPATVYEALLLRERDGSEVATWFDCRTALPGIGAPEDPWLAALAPALARAHLGDGLPDPLPGGGARHDVAIGVDTDVYATSPLEDRPAAVLLCHDATGGAGQTAAAISVARGLLERGIAVTVYGDAVAASVAEHHPFAPQEHEAALLSRHAVVVETGPVPGLERFRLRCAATGTPLVLASASGSGCRLPTGSAAFAVPGGDVARAVEVATRIAREPVSARARVAADAERARRSSLQAEARALVAAITAIGAPT